jgi:hypothetical protein
MFIFKVDVQSDHLEAKCSWVKVSQGKNVTVDISSGSKGHSGQNVGGRNVKASTLRQEGGSLSIGSGVGGVQKLVGAAAMAIQESCMAMTMAVMAEKD